MAPRGKTWTTELEVIGLKFRWKREGRAAIARMLTGGDITGIRIMREPDNQWDENAVMVLLPMSVIEGRQLGYLHRQAAELLAPRLDSGKLQVVSAKLTNLDPDEDYNVGTLVIAFREAGKLPRDQAGKKKSATKGKAAKA